jgi:hypothetical protein
MAVTLPAVVLEGVKCQMKVNTAQAGLVGEENPGLIMVLQTLAVAQVHPAMVDQVWSL